MTHGCLGRHGQGQGRRDGRLAIRQRRLDSFLDLFALMSCQRERSTGKERRVTKRRGVDDEKIRHAFLQERRMRMKIIVRVVREFQICCSSLIQRYQQTDARRARLTRCQSRLSNDPESINHSTWTTVHSRRLARPIQSCCKRLQKQCTCQG